MASRDFYWPRQYAFVRKYIRSCKVCQRVKPGPSFRAPFQPLPIPAECWQSVSMDFVFGKLKDAYKNTAIAVFVNRFSKMGLSRFTAEFWQSVFRSLGTRLNMSTSDHPETDGQTERVNRVLEEILRAYVQSFTSWSEFLPMAEFAMNNSVHA
uniref:Integrase catalytic domain-containing protein n=1 Tax=Peronospora matthiolae TaxID=2874970 RepID=A0AAV1TS35_9STRA